jgi:hypothetical protein
VGKKSKQTKWAAEPNPVEQPKWKDPTIEGQPMAWRFSACDKYGPFGWAALVDPDFNGVIEKLQEFETKTYGIPAAMSAEDCALLREEPRQQTDVEPTPEMPHVEVRGRDKFKRDQR